MIKIHNKSNDLHTIELFHDVYCSSERCYCEEKVFHFQPEVVQQVSATVGRLRVQDIKKKVRVPATIILLPKGSAVFNEDAVNLRSVKHGMEKGYLQIEKANKT